MRLEIVDTCEYCEAERISREDCSRKFGHGHGVLCCVDCCCMGGEKCDCKTPCRKDCDMFIKKKKEEEK
jgi:hypothetical protein